jgi:hypothetical protein
MPSRQSNEGVILLIYVHVLDYALTHEVSELHLSVVILQVLDVLLLELWNPCNHNN